MLSFGQLDTRKMENQTFVDVSCRYMHSLFDLTAIKSLFIPKIDIGSAAEIGLHVEEPFQNLETLKDYWCDFIVN